MYPLGRGRPSTPTTPPDTPPSLGGFPFRHTEKWGYCVNVGAGCNVQHVVNNGY